MAYLFDFVDVFQRIALPEGFFGDCDLPQAMNCFSNGTTVPRVGYRWGGEEKDEYEENGFNRDYSLYTVLYTEYEEEVVKSLI